MSPHMEWRTKLGALLGAGGLLMLAASTVVAVPPTYSISVSKTANPATVPAAGGSVTYTVWVSATGTGFFNVVVVDDGMVGCTLGAPTGDDSDGKLEPSETWAYSCVVTGVTPNVQNTANVNACHDQSACVSTHDAQGSDSITVTGSESPATQPPATEPPATEPPATEPPATEPPATEPPATEAPGGGTPNPTDDVAGATEPTTDTVFSEVVGGGNNGIMLVLALGMLLGSLVLVTPAKPVRQR